MQWPSRRRSRRATRPSAHADTPSPIDDAPIEPREQRELNEPRDATGPTVAASLPRTDWTRATPIRPVITTAPVTVDTARFEQALAGMRDMTHPHPHPHHHGRHRVGLAPAGVLLDVSRVESVIAPGDDEGGAERPVAVADTSIHRRLVPQRAALAPATLTESDLSVPFAGHERTPAPSLERVAWTIEDGFVEPDTTSPPRTRTVRHRPMLATESELADGDDPASDDDQSPTLRFVAAHGPRREQAPRDLADVVARVTGVDVGDAEIDRSPATSQEAAAIGAVAFTRRGTVHLPAELGPIDSPDVRAITAHELVHVAQQRLVSDVPDESSAEGRALESEALAVQRTVLGGGVAPTFLRRSDHRPSLAPLITQRHGVQRLADDTDPSADESGWTGDDYSDADLSDIEPGGPFDPFAWQERDGEPTDDGWEERRDWAERFETENADELQRRRDARYYQLIDDATGRERERLGRRAVMSIRRQLDAEMPYQFGPPSLVEPYPEPLPVAAADGIGADGLGTVVVASLMGSILAGIDLRHVRADARRASARGSTEWSDDDTSASERRLEREREVRLDVLEQKRARAAARGAPASHVVALTDDELAEIRAAIDHELPTDDADRSYLDDDEAVRLSVGGVLDAEPPAPRQGEHRRTPSSPADVDATDSASSAWLRAQPGPVRDDDTADEQAVAARSALRDVTEAAIAAAPPDWTSGAASPEERSGLLAQRQRRERSMRQYVLRAKVLAAIDAGARPGTEVVLTDSELASIRAALDVELPLGDGEFDDDGSAPASSNDEVGSASYTITSADVAELGPAARRRNRGEAASAADDDTAEFDAAEVADAVSGFADFLPDGISDVVGAGFEAFGIAAAVPGALSSLFGIDVTDGDDSDDSRGSSGRTGHSGGPQPVADDELSANVVDSLTEIDLEILTRMLWRRVRREIRGELLIDRERAGVLADFR